jgi:cytochrome P450 enzyme
VQHPCVIELKHLRCQLLADALAFAQIAIDDHTHGRDDIIGAAMATTFEFNPDDPDYVRDPHPHLRALREHAPIYDWQARQSLVFSRHEHLRQLMGDPRLSNNLLDWQFHQPAQLEGDQFRALRRLEATSLFKLPDADHTRVRRLAAGAFTPRVVDRQRATVQAIVDRVLDELTADQTVLNVRDFAERIPGTVISDLVGVPESRRQDFLNFTRASIEYVQPFLPATRIAELASVLNTGEQLLSELIESARSDPRDNLLGDLVRAHEDGQKLSEDELFSLIAGIMTAGSDTTVHALCFATRALMSAPDQLAEIRADRSLLRNAIDETLRWDFFGKMGTFRFARETFEFEGITIPKGKLCVMNQPAALRDPEAFPEPDRFDIHRELGHAVSFGLGRHFCMGASLARLELTLALTSLLLDRYPNARLLGEAEFEQNFLMRPMSKLMLELA